MIDLSINLSRNVDTRIVTFSQVFLSSFSYLPLFDLYPDSAIRDKNGWPAQAYVDVVDPALLLVHIIACILPECTS